MISESTGISLNVAKLPIKKKKTKNKTTDEVFSTRSNSIVSEKFKVKSVGPKIPKSDSNQPNGILKSAKPTGSSIWKKFKIAHKKEGSVNPSFLKSNPKPLKLVKKKVKLKEKPHFIENVECSVEGEKEKFKRTDEEGSVKEVNKPSNQNLEEKKGFKFLDSNNSDTVFNKQKLKTRFFSEHSEKNSVSEYSKSDYMTGKTTSLFGNNPEIPDIPHRAVKPVKEEVFSNLSFEDMELHPYMVKYLKESMGLTKMTTVQEKSIPVLLKKQDALIRSQTGSGKTLAFALPILHKLQEIRPKISRVDGVLALIVVPTRELALQIYEVFNKLVRSYTWIVPGYLVGGEKRKSEKARLRKGISILIGTPGRLIDHIQHTKALSLDKVSWLVIDEADRLLDMGYERDVSILLETLNKDDSCLLKPSYLNPESEPRKTTKSRERQTILLSATLTQKVEKLAGLSLKNPVFIDACEKSPSSSTHVPIFGGDIGDETETMVLPESLVQKYVVTPPKLKLVTLTSFILRKSQPRKQKKMLIFIATQDMVDFYTELLSSIFSASKEEDSDDEDSTPFSNSEVELFKLHGNMKQSERTEVFKTFRKSQLGVLFCTDVASRGLDLPEVDWVIQYTGPTSVSDYVHRVGRTARGGQSGSSIIFLTPNEVSFISKLENCQIRLQEEKMESCLDHLLTVDLQGRSVQEKATELQSMFENMVTQKKGLYDLGCKAFASWTRFYASYPRNMRDAFSVKAIHQGHYAKSFALRNPPSVIVNYARKKNLNEERFSRKRPREWKEREKPVGFQGKNRLSEVSEFDSGLEPLEKKKKKKQK